METCVLIPSDFSLVLSPSTTDRNANRLYEMGVRIWSNQPIAKGSRFSPFQGTIRLDRLEVYSLLDDNDLRNRYGCYDEIQDIENQKVRHCNWIRFIRYITTPTGEVNLIAVRHQGELFYETTQAVDPNTEMVAFYGDITLDRRSPLTSTPVSSRYTNVNLWRQRIEDSPLDLSMSLVSSPPSKSLRSSDDTTWRSSPSVSPASIRPTVVRMPETNTPTEVRKKPRERTLLPCSYCGKAFDRPSLLRRHMRTHTGEKPHVCDVCGKGFSTSSSLNTHRRIHSGEKPHQCPVCGKRFTASSNLYYHRMTHNKEKPHKCALCAKSFPTPGDLKSHMYVHSGTWPYKCHVCSRGFSKQTNLRNHLFLHTEAQKNKCQRCLKELAPGTGMLNFGYCPDCYFIHQGMTVSSPSPETSVTPNYEEVTS